MNFDLSEDQLALRDGIRSLVEDRFDGARVRAGFDRAMFDELDAAGVFSLRADGFSWADAAVVFEELGRGFVPGPLVWSLLARDLDAPAGMGARAGIVGGLEPGPALLVEHPETIEDLVVLERQRLRWVSRHDLTLDPAGPPLDPLTPVARASVVPEGEEVGDAETAAAWRRRGAVVTAAFLVGLATRATELAVEHASTREQFGRVIGTFQAVKHLCADMAVRTELARVAVHAAALHLDRRALGDASLGDEEATRRACAVAKVTAGEAAVANGGTAVQVHGGMGFTWEVDVHLLLKRAWVLDTHFGERERHAASIPSGLPDREP